MEIKIGDKVKLVEWDDKFLFENYGNISRTMKKYFGNEVEIVKIDLYDELEYNDAEVEIVKIDLDDELSYNDGLYFAFTPHIEDIEKELYGDDNLWWIGYEHIKEIVED